MGPSVELIAPHSPQVLVTPPPTAPVAFRALLTHGASWPQERWLDHQWQAAHSSSFLFFFLFNLEYLS